MVEWSSLKLTDFVVMIIIIIKKHIDGAICICCSLVKVYLVHTVKSKVLMTKKSFIGIT